MSARSDETLARSGSDTSALDTVIVTARRQPEKAQAIPISLTVIDAQKLDNNGVSNILSLNELVPTMQVISFNPRNTAVLVRGLGANIAIQNDGVESGVGIYVDGVLYARPSGAIFSLPDILSIEELRGPQGTLYGKNTVAGAINITTAAPSSSFEAHGSVSAGDFSYGKLAGTVSGPLTQDGKLTARLSAYKDTRGGFYKNAYNGQRLDNQNESGGRLQLLYSPDSSRSFGVNADYEYFDSRAPARVLAGVVTVLANGQTLPLNFYQRTTAENYTLPPINPFARVTDLDAPVRSNMEQGGLAIHADWDIGGYRLSTISSGRFWNWKPSNDDDLTSLPILVRNDQTNDQRQVSQEIRLTSPKSAIFEYSGGLYYFWERDGGIGTMAFGPAAPIWVLASNSVLSQAILSGLQVVANSVPRVSSYAAYGQAVWHVTPKIDFTGGGRLTYEDKNGSYSQTVTGANLSGYSSADQATILATRARLAVSNSYSVQVSDVLLGGLATLSYKMSDSTLLYSTYSHGEKSAGMNLSNIAPGTPTVIAPEDIDNFELGLKSSFLDSHIVLNADMFWENDTNYQTTLLDTVRFATYLANIPLVRSRGAELDGDVLLAPGLKGYFSAAYTDASYISFPNAPAPFEAYTVVAGKLNTSLAVDLSDKPLPAVSKWAYSLGLEYQQPLDNFGLPKFCAYVGLDANYRSSYFSNASLSIYSIIPSYTLVNLHTGLRMADNSWDLQFWVRNLFDEKYTTIQGTVPYNSGGVSALLGDPRTTGLTLSMKV